MITPYQPTRSDHQLCQFLQRYTPLHPYHLSLALKIQQRVYGPLDLILWQLGLLSSQDLLAFWMFREQTTAVAPVPA